MDMLSNVRRYLVSNSDVLSEQTRHYAINVYYAGRKRGRLAEVLCAAISEAIGGSFGLGEGLKWFAEGGELMNDMLDSFTNSSLLSEEEKQRGRDAVKRPHTITSMLELLAATDKALVKRRDAEALARYNQRQQAMSVAA